MNGKAWALAGAIVGAAWLVAPPLGAQGPAEAEVPLSQEGARLHFDAVGHRFTVPFPDWLSAAERLSPDVTALVETNVYADTGQAFVEFFPRGQSLDDWQTTYSARITLQPGRSLEDYRQATIYGYSQICKPEAIGVFTFGEQTADHFPALAFICAAYSDHLRRLRGQGEVMVAVFRKTDAGTAMVYQEWRGPAFDLTDPATWPIGRTALEARAEELQGSVLQRREAD